MALWMDFASRSFPGDAPAAPRRAALGRSAVLLTVWLAAFAGGCAAITNPVANGVPVRALPPELLAASVADTVAIPFTWLRRPPSSEYRLAPGDVLGVYIDGVFGDRADVPPVVVPDSSNVPPAVGFPFPVRPDGTVALPLVPPVRVDGMTLSEAERAIIGVYTERDIVNPQRERVLVTLLRPRHERILVVREDNPREAFEVLGASQFGNLRGLGGIEMGLTSQRQGTGTIVDLPAYENDVLSALSRTGGLPGPDAVNEVEIQRGGMLEHPLTGQLNFDPGRTVRIPLRIHRGQPPPFLPEDILLRSGDIVYIRSRKAEFYYTAGLLPARENPLPRDYDLRVIEAIARIGGPILNGGLNSSNLSGAIVGEGIGNPSPTLLTILRRTPDGRQVNIRVDLDQALLDPRENILVRAGDLLILQETTEQALARYVSDVLTLSFFAEIFHRGSADGSALVVGP